MLTHMRGQGTAALHIGGFLGPFGGAVLAVLLPELQHDFHASRDAVALAIPFYLVPFAALQLGSGFVGARFGIGKTVRLGYIAYALASLATAIVPNLEGFLAARFVQGCANAFITPLLLATLGEIVPKARLGRSIGTFASVQTGALAASPLVGGVAGAVDWRLAFIGQALVAAALATLPTVKVARRAPGGQLRLLRSQPFALLCVAGFTGYLGVTGIAVLVSARASDAFALSPTARGLVLACFGLAGMLVGRPLGHVVDRIGRRQSAIVGSVVCAISVAVLPSAPDAVTLAVVWLAAGAGSVFMWNGLNTLAVESTPSARAAAISVFSACKFAGNAAAPLAWLPIYANSVSLSFAAAGATCLVVALCAAAYSSSP